MNHSVTTANTYWCSFQVEVYNGLDTKSIQLDSLAHILYPNLMPLGAYNRADKQARQMEAFYRTNEREVGTNN